MTHCTLYRAVFVTGSTLLSQKASMINSALSCCHCDSLRPCGSLGSGVITRTPNRAYTFMPPSGDVPRAENTS